MNSEIILHYKILEKIGELASSIGTGGPARRNRHNYNLQKYGRTNNITL
jgi:hypothetical protein